jgi:hypothetical protein
VLLLPEGHLIPHHHDEIEKRNAGTGVLFAGPPLAHEDDASVSEKILFCIS